MKTMILCANGQEECEALIPYDMLFRAGIEVELVGLEKEITSSHNLTYQTHKVIGEVKIEEYNCLVLPGGMPGTINLENDERVSKLIDDFVRDDKYICAICAAPSILIHKGLSKNEKFVCFPSFENGLVPAKEKAYRDNKFITAKGMGASIEFGYKIIEALIDKTKAEEILKKIQY